MSSALQKMLHAQAKADLIKKNLRLISLLNFDYKLLTKVLANGVKKVIPSIISASQTAYVKDRSVTDSVRLVQDIIHLLDLQKITWTFAFGRFSKSI